MQPLRIADVACDIGAGAQPHPAAIGVAQAKGVVDPLAFSGDNLLGDIAELHVVWMRKALKFTDRQRGFLRGHSDKRAHGIGKRDGALFKVPFPQSASATRQGGCKPDAFRRLRFVELPQTICLPVERHADQQHQQIH